MSTAPTPLACPDCRATDRLATIERVLGHAPATFPRDDEPEFDGSTELFWDTSITIGVHCDGCDFDHVGDDWRDQLIDAQEPAA